MSRITSLVLRVVFSWIDALTVKLITLIYKLLSDLSELVIYGDNIVKLLGRRIGLILGIFMLFKLAISLINYMISPDKLNDSKQGGGRLILNVCVSLALLISINFIFKEAYVVQGTIINSRIIEKIFFGNSGLVTSNNDTETDPDNPKTKLDIGYYLYSGFALPNNDVFEDTCDDMWDVSKDITDECDKKLLDNTDGEVMKTIYKARNSLDMSYVFSDYDMVLAETSNKTFVFEYMPIASNIAGIVILLVLLSFSMDLATRAVKLLFLQIIAPIPIISNMDMGKGQDIFKKWTKECINTYLSVFIRLIAINFAVFMIVLLRGSYKEVFVNNIWLNIFLIVGCLMFAKQVPGLIEDFLGIKLNGMALHPLKKFQEQALLGKQITGIAGGAAKAAVGGSIGAFAGIAGGIAGSRVNGDPWYKTTGWAFGGAVRGFAGGIGSGVKSKNIFGAIGAGRSRYTATSSYVKSLDNTSLGGRIKAGAQQFFNAPTDADTTKKEIDLLNGFSTAADSALKRAENEMVKYNNLTANGITMAQHKAMQQQLEILKSQGVDRSDSKYWSGTTFDEAAFDADVEAYAEKLRKMQDTINKNQKDFATQYISDVQRGRLRNDSGQLVSDSETQVLLDSVYHYRDELSEKFDINLDTRTGKAIKDSKQDANVARQHIESEHINGYNTYERQQANAAATKPKGKAGS